MILARVGGGMEDKNRNGRERRGVKNTVSANNDAETMRKKKGGEFMSTSGSPPCAVRALQG
jgi:hypothetical protein